MNVHFPECVQKRNNVSYLSAELYRIIIVNLSTFFLCKGSLLIHCYFLYIKVNEIIFCCLYIFNQLLSFFHTILTLNTLEKRGLFKTAGQGENAGDRHFLLFPQCFLPIPKRIYVFKLHLLCLLQMHSILTGLKICCLGKELFEEQ